jgi:hypothetical protein
MKRYQQKLTVEQRQSLVHFLRAFPLNSLRNEYRNPYVFDGMQITFDIRLDQGPHKEIFLANEVEPNLESLCRQINQLVPEKLQVGLGRSSVTVPDATSVGGATRPEQ